jgi:periplasmic protein TonB
MPPVAAPNRRHLRDPRIDVGLAFEQAGAAGHARRPLETDGRGRVAGGSPSNMEAPASCEMARDVSVQGLCSQNIGADIIRADILGGHVPNHDERLNANTPASRQITGVWASVLMHGCLLAAALLSISAPPELERGGETIIPVELLVVGHAEQPERPPQTADLPAPLEVMEPAPPTAPVEAATPPVDPPLADPGPLKNDTALKAEPNTESPSEMAPPSAVSAPQPVEVPQQPVPPSTRTETLETPPLSPVQEPGQMPQEPAQEKAPAVAAQPAMEPKPAVAPNKRGGAADAPASPQPPVSPQAFSQDAVRPPATRASPTASAPRAATAAAQALRTSPPRPATEQRRAAAKATDDRPSKRSSTAQAAAQRGGTGGSAATAGAGEVASWRARVLAHLARFKTYPEWARDQGVEGRATVAFTLTRGGQATSVSLAASSGSGILDQATLAMVRRATPFPAMPEGGPASMSFTAAIRYDLR